MRFVFAALVALLAAHLSHPTDPTDQTDQRRAGIAAEFSNDKGISGDKRVLFAEDFESGNLKAWQEKKEPVSLSADRPRGGSLCVEMPMNRGKNTGGHLVHWFMPGSERVFARFYVRFSPDYKYPHHFVHLLANPQDDRWRAFGKAGRKPDGTYFTTGMEAWFAWGRNPPPGELHLYSYFMDMEIDRKMNLYWGNSFFPPGPGKGEAASAGRVIPVLDKWQCWEFMVKANSSPDKADGEQAMWLDGKPAGRFTGIRWRADINLKINTLWLLHYGMDPGDPTKSHWPESQTVWFDDVVVATAYIGTVKSEK